MENKLTKDILLSYLTPTWKEALVIDYPELFDDKRWDDICIKLSSGIFKPKLNEVFNALNHIHPKDVKCVILGQDPYPKLGDAHGYSFSTLSMSPPASLKNILTELSNEYCLDGNTKYSYNLEKWEQEGVLLLNSILTVGEQPRSHEGLWEFFTSKIIEYVNNHNVCVFIAWGAVARKICEDNQVKIILRAGHPSLRNMSNQSLFLGCNHFKECNDILREHNVLPIRWLVIKNN